MLVVPRGVYFGLASSSLSRGEGVIVEVEHIDLVNVLSGCPEVRLIKIDAGGGEYEVLKGARETLKKQILSL